LQQISLNNDTQRQVVLQMIASYLHDLMLQPMLYCYTDAIYCSVEAQSAALHAAGLDAVARGMLFADSRTVDIYMLQAAAPAPASAITANSTAAGGTAATGTAANDSDAGSVAADSRQRQVVLLSTVQHWCTTSTAL
jgi:hypothetical protein